MIRPTLPILLLAMLLPSLAAWVYFDLLAGSTYAAPAYLGAKLLQLCLPIYVFRNARIDRRFETRLPRRGAGMLFGILTGTLLLASTLGCAYLLREQLAEPGLHAQIESKLKDFHLTTPRAYLIFALLVSGAHSLFEEVYWRWLVFGGLRVSMRWPPAAILSSLAFAAHHLLVLRQYFPAERFWTHALPFSLLVAAGGGIWAWLYQRHSSLLGPWISHVFADLAIFWVGYQMFFG